MRCLSKVFIISIFTQICFGRLTFLRENVNLPKKFDKNLFLNPPKTQIPVTKVFIVWHVKNKCNFCQIFFGRLTFSRKNGEIKDFSIKHFSIVTQVKIFSPQCQPNRRRWNWKSLLCLSTFQWCHISLRDSNNASSTNVLSEQV